MGPQDAPERIWLKQAIQFSVAGQLRTIEIALPVRPDASAEEIERLLRQADAGLDQMTQHLGKKVEELLRQGQAQMAGGMASSPGRASPGIEGSAEASSPGARATSSGYPRNADMRAGMASQAPESAGQLTARPTDLPDSTGSSLIDRKQFIAEIAVLGLNPRQAMERLGIRTLDGINLHQALEQLRLQLLRERALPTRGPSADAEETHATPSRRLPRTGNSSHTDALPQRQPPELKHGPLPSQVAPLGRTAPHPLPEGGFPGEDEEQMSTSDAAQEQSAELEPPEPLPAPIPIRGERTLISIQERLRAQSLLDRLRRLRGRLNPPSSDNLKAFHYVVEDQLGVAKTAALLQAIWNVSQPEKLSPDQVLECIRWGKDDHFEDDVDMLLSLTAGEDS
jgi:hypothetical protein